MIDLSYTLTPKLKDGMETVNYYREKILLTSLSTQQKLHFVFNLNVKRVTSVFSLIEDSVEEGVVEKVLLDYPVALPAHTPSMIKKVAGFRQGFDFIRSNWLVTDEVVTLRTLILLYKQVTSTFSARGNLVKPYARKALAHTIQYLERSKEPALNQAAIIYVAIRDAEPFSSHNNYLAHLASYLLLYKHGYDVNGLLVLEEEWAKNKNIFETELMSTLNTGRITPWLEYVAETTGQQLKEVYRQLTQPRIRDNLASITELNERQRNILIITEKPGLRITNAQVQKLAKVSQITASRDLAKLSSLGLLYPHGGGRSTYYTRV